MWGLELPDVAEWNCRTAVWVDHTPTRDGGVGAGVVGLYVHAGGYWDYQRHPWYGVYVWPDAWSDGWLTPCHVERLCLLRLHL